VESIHLLIIPGSSRNGSFNLRLAAAVGDIAAAAGHRVSRFDLRELGLPLYDGDLEAAAGVPPATLALQDAIDACDAVLFVTPEYNGFPTPLVINAFDWLSRIPAAAPGRSGLATTANKPAALLSASPGPLGGLRSMGYLRQYLQMAFAMMVVPQQFALANANEAFAEDGSLKDAKAAQAVDRVIKSLLALAAALKSPSH
jgi:NAD(P)H-dependent FMN reductase